MYRVSEILKARSDVISGEFQGVIQTHKVDEDGNRLESNPEKFLEITYPTSAIKRALENVSYKLSKRSNQGAFLLTGPYGSGKSHTLITLYHLFNNPKLARSWCSYWKIDLNLPNFSRAVIVSTRKYDVDKLWEPIFILLGNEKAITKVRRFPTIGQIEDIIRDDTVAIFIDEIENWYGSFDPEKDAHLIEQNETFLEHLLEVASDPNRNLFVFISFLEEKEGLKKIFNRTKPIRIDVSPIDDREKVILHRLFENTENTNEDKVEAVIEAYISKYSEPIKINNKQQYKQRMIRTYPFHPLLLDTLFQIYEAAADRQDVRGMLNVLADAVRDTYKKKDLILISDVDENAFRGIDLRLIEKYEYDLRRVKGDTSFAEEILKTILIFTLNDKTHGATESDILLSIFRPTEGHTLNSILMDIENIYGKPHYLHKENGVYLFKHELNIYALLEKEKSKIAEEDIKKEIVQILKGDVFENRVFIFGFEEIPDHNKIKIVVIPESWGVNDDLRVKLNEFYKGRTWQNTYILVLPEVKTVFSFEILEKGKRLKAAKNLLEQVEDKEGKLRRIIQEEKENIANKIKTFYGFLVKWVERDEGLTYRLINVSPDINSIREKARSDQGLVADFIVELVEDKPSGIRIEDLINDFKRYRKYPFILEDEDVYSAIRNLHRDKRVIIQGDRGKWYIDEHPNSLEPSFVIVHPKYAPSSTQGEYEQEITNVGIDTKIAQQSTDVYRADTENDIKVERKERKSISLYGNSPRVILSQIEARTSDKDEFEEITVRYKFKQNLSKDEIMRFIKQLPQQENSEIEADIRMWSEKHGN